LAVLARLMLLAVLLPVPLTEARPDPLNEIGRWARYGTESGVPSVLDLAETGVARTEARLAWYDAYPWHRIEEEARWPTRPEATSASFQIAPPLYRHPLFLATVLL